MKMYMIAMMVMALRMHPGILTTYNFNLMCDCVMAEAGGESPECQEAVATVILNRVYCPDKFPSDIEGVLCADNQFVFSGSEPTEEVKESVLRALCKYGTLDQCINKSCYYFRAGHYHDFGIQYMHIDNTYFTLAENFAE